MLSLIKEFRFLYRAWRYRLKVERDEVAFILSQLNPGDRCIDVGGHKGAFTYWMQRSVGRTGRVIAFEPQPELAAYLDRVRDALRMSHVTIVNAAASSESGTRILFRDTPHPTPGATLENTDGEAVYQTNVSTVRLDDYIDSDPSRPIRLIKCDVEGHELDVFRGAQRILQRDRPTLLFECEQRHRSDRPISEVFEFLESCGYEGAFFKQGRLRDLVEFQPERNVHGQPGYVYNFVFHPNTSQGLARTAA